MFIFFFFVLSRKSLSNYIKTFMITIRTDGDRSYEFFSFIYLFILICHLRTKILLIRNKRLDDVLGFISKS